MPVKIFNAHAKLLPCPMPAAFHAQTDFNHTLLLLL